MTLGTSILYNPNHPTVTFFNNPLFLHCNQNPKSFILLFQL